MDLRYQGAFIYRKVDWFVINSNENCLLPQISRSLHEPGVFSDCE